MKQEFTTFLEANGLVNKFNKNFARSRPKETLEEYFSRTEKHLYLVTSFSWENSTEGSDFWVLMNSKWRQRVRGVRNEK